MKTKFIFPTMFNNKPTFWGVYQRYTDEFHRTWKAESTQGNAIGNIALICRLLYNHDGKHIGMYTRKDFDKVITKIRRRGKGKPGEKFVPYDEDTIARFEFIIRRVVEIAAAHGDCIDVFDKQYEPPNTKKVKKQEKKIVKSLSIRQYVMAYYMLSNYKQSGKKMALFLMLKGLRNAEAVAADFIDIKPMDSHPGKYELWVYKTAKRNKNDRKGSGKTPNADRILPLTAKEYEFLMKRKKYVTLELIKMGMQDLSIVDKLPIACADNDYFTPLSSNDISNEGRAFFDELKIEREELMELRSDLKEALKHNDEEIDPIEDDLTSYVLRRAYATRLHIMGFDRDMISYIIGHEIPDSPFCRNDFRYSELRMEILDRMELMPLVGSYNPESIEEIEVGSTVEIERGGKYVVSADVDVIHVHVVSREPKDTIKVTQKLSSKAINVEEKVITSFTKLPIRLPQEIDVIRKFHQLHREVQEELKSLKEAQKKDIEKRK